MAVEVPPADATTEEACGEAVAALPDELRDAGRREVEPASPQAAAWGDPAIVLVCGVPPPGPTTEDCVEVDGVQWVAVDTDAGYRFTTYGRVPAVRVDVPEDYAPEVNPLVPLAPALRALPQDRFCT